MGPFKGAHTQPQVSGPRCTVGAFPGMSLGPFCAGGAWLLCTSASLFWKGVSLELGGDGGPGQLMTCFYEKLETTLIDKWE